MLCVLCCNSVDASSVVIEDNIHSSKGGLRVEGVEHDITCKSNEGNPAPVINYHTNGIVGTRLMTLRNVPGNYISVIYKIGITNKQRVDFKLSKFA